MERFSTEFLNATIKTWQPYSAVPLTSKDAMEITETYLEYLNEVQSEIGERNYPFTNFVYKFFDELIADLVEQNQISQCQFCGDFFPINNRQKTKKYCSPKYEGKDCGKKARNKIDYERHKEERKAKARKTTKE